MKATTPGEAHDGALAPYIAHDEFRRELAAGRMRIVVDPGRARAYVSQRTRISWLAGAAILVGAALALTGQAWVGAVFVAAGILARRAVLWQAPKITLHLALRDEAAYTEVTGNGVMEARRAS